MTYEVRYAIKTKKPNQSISGIETQIEFFSADNDYIKCTSIDLLRHK